MEPLSTTISTDLVPPATLSLLRVDARERRTLQEQLVEQLRQMILERALRPGQRLPSTRSLADQLAVSRNTVLAVFDQLVSEGYLQGTRGSGTYVSAELPDRYLGVAPPMRAAQESWRTTSTSATMSVGSPPGAIVVKPFRPCVPSVAEFPIEVWERLRRRVLNRSGVRLLQYGAPAGDERLREQIAIYLRDFRGVRCVADQIVVTTGAQQAFNLIGRVLGGPGGGIWFEDPGYIDARLAFENAGMRIVPQGIDPEGLTIPTWCAGAPRVVYTTPSRQFPLGTTMSLARRVEWLRFAAQHGMWLVEDDYDSEFRYEGRPLPSLQGLMPEARVVYVGTFSKSLYPSLRIGYVVAPAEHVRSFWEAKETADVHTPSVNQAVLAEFMREGHFVRHLRKMRALYAERAETFAEAVAREWRGLVTLASLGAGLNVAGWLESGDDAKYAKLAADHGFQAIALGRYAVQAKLRPGFLFGFGAYTPAQIRRAAHELGAAWSRAARRG
jgi:GntR family transcriptional regulator / MocR family aminotransferase